MKTKNLLNRILAMLAAFLLMLFVGVESTLSIPAKAENVSDFEKNAVLDDLENSFINGEEFSLKTFNFDESKNTEVISFLEYGYSFYAGLQDDFGLYVYVYNPQGLDFETNSSLHTITFKIGEDENLHYLKYPLAVLNFSQENDYYGLFYKLKVVLTDTQKNDILSELNSIERVYAVSEIELKELSKTNATVIPVNGKYGYSGYMSGLGSNSLTESTLKCVNSSVKTVSLEAHPTVYRPKGTNGKNDYTQDSLHSVYFAVPNEVIALYGEMSAVHASWLNAVTAPALVTGNYEAYEAILSFMLGCDISGLDFLNYAYIGAYEKSLGQGGQVVNNTGDIAYIPYNFWLADVEKYESVLSVLYYAFYAGEEENSADSYVVSSKEFYAYLKDSGIVYGGDLINDKFSEFVFSEVDEEFTEVNISREADYSLTSEVISQNWWQKLWGTGTTTTTTFDGIKAIYSLSDKDFAGVKEDICDSLYINQSDYDDLKQFYEEHKGNSTIYLFRYQVSDYMAQEATLFSKETTFLDTVVWNSVDTNAYFFQETVNLDFDIIDITCSTAETETVIPVVMAPIDIVPPVTPPVNTEDDTNFLDEINKILKSIRDVFLAIVAILLFIGVCWIISLLKPIFVIIFKGAWKIICFPFKLLGKLFGRKK